MSQSSAASRERRRSATSLARSSRVPASLRRSPSSTSSRERRVAAAQAGEQLGVAQRVRDRAPRLRQEPAHVVEVPRARVVQVDEADDLVVADQRDGGGALEVPLEVVLALVLGDALVVERADDEDLPVLHRLLGGRVVVEVQDRAADLLVHAVRRRRSRGSGGTPPRATRCRSPRSRSRAAAASRRAPRCPRLLGEGQLRAQLHELVPQARDLARLAQERRAVEHAGDELADAGHELHVVAPVALGVVVQVDQPDQLAAGDQRHRERAGVAPSRGTARPPSGPSRGSRRSAITRGVWSSSVRSSEG